jgi:hypothetical protein
MTAYDTTPPSGRGPGDGARVAAPLLPRRRDPAEKASSGTFLPTEFFNLPGRPE